jgi:hypothetical protein
MYTIDIKILPTFAAPEYAPTTLSITTLSLNDTEHNNAAIIRVICAECLKTTECCYAKCHYAEGHGTFSNASGNNTIVIWQNVDTKISQHLLGIGP